jgi:hypothetical protein
MTNAIAAGAAVAAALFSILNVVLSNRFARGAQVQQWRRDSARKAFTDLLDSAREALDAKRDLARWLEPGFKEKLEAASVEVPDFVASEFAKVVRRDEVDVWSKAAKAIESLLYNLEELELVASAECVAAARAFVDTVDSKMPRTLIEEDGVAGKLQVFMDHLPVYEDARRSFVLACRRDLGVGRGRSEELT